MSQLKRVIGSLAEQASTQLDIARKFNAQAKRLDKSIDGLKNGSPAEKQIARELLEVKRSLLDATTELLQSSNRAARTVTRESRRS